MNAYITIVRHQYGTDILYAGGNEKTAYSKLAKYCRDWWFQEGLDSETGIYSEKRLARLKDETIIKKYFNNEAVIMNGEEGSVQEITLEDMGV